MNNAQIDTCCSSDNQVAPEATIVKEPETNNWLVHLPLLLSIAIMVVMAGAKFLLNLEFSPLAELTIYLIGYILAAYGVIRTALKKLIVGDIFNEFFLMTLATAGAFYIGEYSEGVAVMIFYRVGEWFQEEAVNRSKRSIKALLDIRPETVTILRNKLPQVSKASQVQIGEIIQIKAGEKVGLDGELLSEAASFNTAALTGESKPATKSKGEMIYAGMINLNTVSELKVTSLFQDSKLSRILEMVQNATAQKSKTQLFISRFAKVYTPIVVFLAVGICILPYFFVPVYEFDVWLYRALVFLVISCPCALVISIPLGYFGGIGLASRNGILFKGANLLDLMTKVRTVLMDKTGTLTKGIFKVQQVVAVTDEDELVRLTAALESHSTHPIAIAINQYSGNTTHVFSTEKVEEIAGHGLKGIIDGKEVLAGNGKLLKRFGVIYPAGIETIIETTVAVAIDRQYAGYIIIADELKDDAAQTIRQLHNLGIKTIMLSGDKQSMVDKVAKSLNISAAFGDLLPENKVARAQEIKNAGVIFAFVGDGVNDAPVVALADVGIAMGGLGSDATIETADVVIQTDQPSKIVQAINAGIITRRIVWQNIILALGVKIIVLMLGSGGIATLWEAVFADVGVALLAILNAVRIQKLKL